MRKLPKDVGEGFQCLEVSDIDDILEDATQANLRKRAGEAQREFFRRKLPFLGGRGAREPLAERGFVIFGDVECRKRCEGSGAQFAPYVEATAFALQAAGNGKGLQAVAVINDPTPSFEYDGAACERSAVSSLGSLLCRSGSSPK